MFDKNRLARLRWNCRRGMLELDLMLLPFLEQKFQDLNASDQSLFEELLACQDQDLYRWLVTKEKPSDDRFVHLIQIIRNAKHL